MWIDYTALGPTLYLHYHFTRHLLFLTYKYLMYVKKAYFKIDLLIIIYTKNFLDYLFV